MYTEEVYVSSDSNVSSSKSEQTSAVHNGAAKSINIDHVNMCTLSLLQTTGIQPNWH